MARRRECAVTDSKKPKQVKISGAKKEAKTKDAGTDMTEEQEKLYGKDKFKPCSFTKRAVCNTSSTTSITTTTVKTSKYFQSPLKEEEPDSEDGFDMVTSTAPVVTVNIKDTAKEEKEMDSEEDEDEWEEVEELVDPVCPVELREPPLCSQMVEIEIETPEVRKKQKRQAELETHLRRMMNRYKKDQLIDTHKVHLMCLIASGMFHNRLCSEADLLAITLSLLPSHFGMVTKERFDQNHISGLLKWFRETFTLNLNLPCEESKDPRAVLERRLASQSVRNHQEMTHLFLLVLRSLQLFCRLVLSLQPVPLKLPPVKGKSTKTTAGAPGKTSVGQGILKTTSPEPKVSPGSKRPGVGNTEGDRGGKKARRKKAKEEDVEEEENAIISGGQRPKNLKRRTVASKLSYKEESDSEGENIKKGISDEKEFQMTREEDSANSENRAKSTMKKVRGESKVTKSKNIAALKGRSDAGKKQVKEEDQEWKEEEECDEDVEGMTSSEAKRKSGKKEGPGTDEWLEVYLEKTSSWVCVDVEHGVGMPHLCSQKATAPVTYVVSIDGDGFVKDLGRKYDPTWMTSSRKRRVDDDWWEETLEPFLGPEDDRDIQEDKELQNKLLNKPLPTSVAEYKNHPLYALKRHLLKYEAIYPSTATVLGYCRGEPVYSRDCVHTLHSRETWLKEARTVRLGEEPYKMVKSFSNRSRKARIMSEIRDDKDLPLFGEWQTEEYQPPIAVKGKIPRNDYGNVYLFKTCMLPVGCVHLRLPNLHRVARKLNLDAAPAVIGFDFHGGYSHAVTDGYIVCEEHEEILRAAWLEEQNLKKQKDKEKIEKRAISNWTLLVKGLVIRERLKQRYGKKDQELGSLTHSEEAGGLSSDEEVVEGEVKTASETLAMSWPQNRQAEKDRESNSRLNRKNTTKREKRGQEKHLFPFEKA